VTTEDLRPHGGKAGDSKVLHVITGLASGGAERQLLLTASADPSGTEVISLTGEGFVAERLRECGVPLHVVGMRSNRDAMRVIALLRTLRNGRFHAVHLHLFRALVFGAPLARLAGVQKVVFTEHSLNRSNVEGRAVSLGVRMLYRVMMRLVDTVIAVSDDVQQRLVEVGVPANKIVIRPNVLDISAWTFQPASRQVLRAQLGVPAGVVMMGVVGRLEVPKNVAAAILAVSAMLGPDLRLVVTGDGSQRLVLEDLVEQLHIQPWVIFTGERDDVPRLLSAFDLLIAPAPEETFALSVIEARLSGLPVVYCSCPAFDMVSVPDPGALRCPPRPDAIAHAVMSLLSSGLARVPAPAQLRSRFDASTAPDSFARLYGRR